MLHTFAHNGESIIINVPILTEERRRELAKKAKAEGEHAKVSIRNDRKEGNNELKKLDISKDQLANGEVDIQLLTDNHIKKVDDLYAVKEIEIMKV
jgi:ribosome recycling factor